MKTVLGYLLPNFILVLSMLYIWHILVNKKINYKDYRFYVTIVGLMCVSITNYIFVNKYIRMFILILFFILFFKYLFREKIYRSIIAPIYYQIIAMISETIYALILTVILKIDAQKFLMNDFGVFITNLSVALISILIVKIKFIRNLYTKIINFTDKIKSIQLFTFLMLIIIIENVLIMSAYYSLKFEHLLIFNSIVTLICFSIILYSIITQNKFSKVSDKYNMAIKSLNNYEDMMSRNRIANHENKNLLLTIRAMVLNNEKDIPNYIDTIIENKYNDDEKLLLEMARIPSGGLRATIYSSILKIKDNNINYNLNIDKKIRLKDLIELKTDLIVDICKIIGVFVDNAIEAVSEIKNKYINIDIYLENKNLIISISNTYSGDVKIEKIYAAGYSTKGKNHGYGLSLVKKLVDQNDLLENNVMISKEVFTQVLRIKNKKTH